MHLDLGRVTENVRHAETTELLDRLTIFRAEMEAQAIAIIVEELTVRGVTPAIIAEHAEKQNHYVRRTDGTVRRCAFCLQAAIATGWRWHRLWGVLPVFPRWCAWCAQHAPKGKQEANSENAIT